MQAVAEANDRSAVAQAEQSNARSITRERPQEFVGISRLAASDMHFRFSIPLPVVVAPLSPISPDLDSALQ